MNGKIVENLFRHESGHIISRLSARYGMLHLSEIEDAVSDAMVRAIKAWSIGHVPDNPGAWLHTVANRILLDELRRKKMYYEKVISNHVLINNGQNEKQDEYATLKLMLWCAHPELTEREQLGLILQLVSGFSITEISSAFIMKYDVLKKQLQRARSKLKKLEDQLILPDLETSHDRWPILRSAIYLGFNEGYFSISADNLIREDMIFEALRLCKLLCDTPHEDLPISYALLALLLYHTSRIPARRSVDNALILLEDQDRTLWDQNMIRLANSYMESAMQSEYYTPYHIEATIAAIHTQTKEYNSTNWAMISDLYGKLTEVDKSPIVILNYAFSLIKADKLQTCTQVLSQRSANDFGIHQYLYFSVMSQLAKGEKNKKKEKLMLWRAIDSAPNDVTRKVLVERMNSTDT